MPGSIDPSTRGEVVAVVRQLYPVTARVANAYARGDPLGADLAHDWRRTQTTCRDLPSQWSEDSPTGTGDDRRRQHLVLAGCQMLLSADATAGDLDGVLSLFTLAIASPDASLLPVRSRGS
jgi:hypothetical protein